ncbi:aminotransferase class I/II-fold pyridoxal phosphate-dependent enzyme [Anaeromyxobacter oryzisoli]|uniref:aminotransferase class I/II-fold pyridoxal phosphate-dependent enzyme n=1 Tax=Anaeromyxobacter oryzisoli TaxID=2925408 RepID=UPI001F571AD4|nr:aminotransferase class I/II-fold pyridoxal phosphate-dependent enzyme [Anaeromyxobacter sp. SG63]
MSPPALHPLAQASNDALAKDCPVVLDLLSARGKRFFFPAKGILAQGAEAKKKAKTANATVGIATENGAPMHLACVGKYYQGLTPSEIFDYAPSQGRADIRAAWAKKQRGETPSLGDHLTSTPVVTNALTHGLGLVGDLFLDPGDQVLSSELMWENYNLNWETRLEARFNYYALFDEKLTGFNLPGFTAALAKHRGKKLLVSLNFPNNPSGYTPTRKEADGIVQALTAEAEAGTRLVVCVDDAYYGMLFDEDATNESLFGRLAQASNNLLAVKVDGATKEEFVWGLRVGFITFGVKNGTAAAYKALEDKAAGIIRSYISNVSNPGQSVVLKALGDPEFRKQQAEKIAVLRARAAVVAKECRRPEYADCWDVYPFNSGYFMCLRLKDADADTVRVRLLDEHGVGTIALGKRELRIAFSCLAEPQIPGVFSAAAKAVRSVRGK